MTPGLAATDAERPLREADRLLRLAEQLYRDRGGSAAELAARLGVSRSTIRRDVARLRLLGAPVELGWPSGYVLRHSHAAVPLRLSRDALHVIRAALAAYVKILPSDGTLGTALGLQRDLAHQPAWVEPGDHPGLLVTFSQHQSHAGRVRQAITGQNKLLLRYYDRATTLTERVVWPLRIDEGDWPPTLAAWCELRNGYRTFMVRSINHTEVLADAFPGDPDAMLAAWAADRAERGEADAQDGSTPAI